MVLKLKIRELELEARLKIGQLIFYSNVIIVDKDLSTDKSYNKIKKV